MTRARLLVALAVLAEHLPPSPGRRPLPAVRLGHHHFDNEPQRRIERQARVVLPEFYRRVGFIQTCGAGRKNQ